MENRKWSVELAELSHYHFLKSKTLIIRKRFDDRYVFLPVGVEKLLAEIKPDLVFAMEYNPTILRAVHWCRKKRIPFISWTDGTLNSEKISGRCSGFPGVIIKRAAAFVASSTASKQAQIAYGADEKKCFLSSYLTVDIQKYLREKEDYSGRELLYVGSLIQRKGWTFCFRRWQRRVRTFTLRLLVRDRAGASYGTGGKAWNYRPYPLLGYVEGAAARTVPQRGCLHPADQRGLFRTRDLRGDVCVASGDLSSKYADGAFDLVAEGRTATSSTRRIHCVCREDRSDFCGRKPS